MNENFVPELDRWMVWMVVKSLDLPYLRLVELLALMDVPIYKDDNGKEYISRMDFKNYLYDTV